MKIAIWTYEKNLKILDDFLKNESTLPKSFEYFLNVPLDMKDIYVVQVLLLYDDYVRLRDY
tara:strand:- start:9563 stop:9745 length:183 start_codon:yes stop_codon:yes gene_type:complete